MQFFKPFSVVCEIVKFETRQIRKIENTEKTGNITGFYSSGRWPTNMKLDLDYFTLWCINLSDIRQTTLNSQALHSKRFNFKKIAKKWQNWPFLALFRLYRTNFWPQVKLLLMRHTLLGVILAPLQDKPIKRKIWDDVKFETGKISVFHFFHRDLSDIR